MSAGPVNTRFLPLLLLVLLCSCSGNVIQTTVFRDDFGELDPGFIMRTDSGDPAIYFHPGRGAAGEWTVATSLRQEGFNEAWKVIPRERSRILAQTFTNLDRQNEPLSLITHPIMVAGDSLWEDYKIEVDFTPLAKFDKCGVVFGYQHPYDFFFFGTEGNTVILKHIQQSVTPLRPIERILEYRPLVWTPGEEMHAVVTVRRNKISTILNDSIRMYEESEMIRPGCIGLISDLPAEFSRVEVQLLKGELRKLNRKKRQLARRREIHLERHPAMVRWKTFDTNDFGTDQNIRLGDLTGDGNKEVLFVRSCESDPSVCCISAMNLEGSLLWQYGNKDAAHKVRGEELPVQIHDLDGDGAREVLFADQGRIYVLDGMSGELVRRERIPVQMEVRTMLFGDLLGTGRDNCMVLSDRDRKLAVLNEKLELMWEQDLGGASQPLVQDLDGDGHDEVLSGYCVFSHEGVLRFDAGTYIGDRCNGVSVYEMVKGDRVIPCLLYAAGDWGLMYVDLEGHVLKQNILGHVRYMSIADFDAEKSGLEVITSNSWGSDGLMYVSDAEGQVRHMLMQASGLSRCVPVNWKGDGEEFFIVSADSLTGGMFDKLGQLAVAFPSDGHPVDCHLVQDVTGDVRDEVIVWDDRRLWIYTQSDNPRMGNTYHPDRIPAYNHSMYHMNRSTPGW
jgi:rhamnogalacturonan endolyase